MLCAHTERPWLLQCRCMPAVWQAGFQLIPRLLSKLHIERQEWGNGSLNLAVVIIQKEGQTVTYGFATAWKSNNRTDTLLVPSVYLYVPVLLVCVDVELIQSWTKVSVSAFSMETQCRTEIVEVTPSIRCFQRGCFNLVWLFMLLLSTLHHFKCYL